MDLRSVTLQPGASIVPIYLKGKYVFYFNILYSRMIIVYGNKLLFFLKEGIAIAFPLFTDYIF